MCMTVACSHFCLKPPALFFYCSVLYHLSFASLRDGGRGSMFGSAVLLLP